MNEGRIPVASRRIFIMVVALLAPELMITWATRQFFSARKAANEFNDAFGAQLAQAYGNHRNARKSEARLYNGPIPGSDESDSSGTSAPRASGIKFKGRVYARTLQSAVTNILNSQNGQ